jgi:hypothetical protein
MPLLVPQLIKCPSMPRAEDKDVFYGLSSSAASKGGRNRGDSGLEEKSIQAIYSRIQLDSQRALCLPKPLMEVQDVRPWGASTTSRLGGLVAEDCHCCSQRALVLQFALVEMAAGRLGSSS